MSRDLPFGIRLTIAYDGTAFAGWQVQPRQRTVQETIEEALTGMRLKHSKVRGASRTDSGVHAMGQVASVAIDRDIPPRGIALGLTGLLPDDVSITSAARCDRRYNPRYDAQGKLYRYLIKVGATRDPLTRHRAWYVSPTLARRDRRERGHFVDDYLCVDAMRDAAQRLCGTHDFRAFRAASDYRENTVRTLRGVRVIPGLWGDPALLAIEVEGDAFMKNMVRILAGTLLDIGRQRYTPDLIDHMFTTGARRGHGGPTAPAHGLCLVRIDLRRGDYYKVPRR